MQENVKVGGGYVYALNRFNIKFQVYIIQQEMEYFLSGV